MPNYNHVLAALDLTPDSAKVLAHAKRLCDSEWRRLHLVHVAEHPVTALGSSTGKNHRHGEQEVRQEVFPKLQALAQGVSPDHMHIVFGDPAAEITYLADKLGTEVIVIGSHSESGLKRLLGSNTSSIIHSAPCDVLTVRTHKPQRG